MIDSVLSACCKFFQILPVTVFEHWLGKFQQLFLINPSLFECDFFQTCHFQTLSLFDDFYKGTCFRKTVVGAGVKPGKTAL